MFLIPLGIYSGVELLGLSLERLDLVYKLRVPWGPVKREGREIQRGSGEEEVGAGEEQFSSGSLTFSVDTP